MLAPALGKQYLIKSSHEGGSRLYDVGYEINGLGRLADDFATLLSQLTGCKNTKLLTLLSLNGIMPSRGPLRHNKAWCPQCLQEWQEHNMPIYEPLLWNISLVRNCQVHKVELRENCPQCGKLIPVLSRKTKNGYCSYCRCWLGSKQVDTSIFYSKNHCNYFFENNIAELIKLGQLSNFIDSLKPIHYCIQEIIDAADGQSNFSRIFGIPKSTVNSWYNGNHKPSLNTIMKILYLLDIPISDFLNMTLSYSILNAKIKAINTHPSATSLPKRRVIDWSKIEMDITHIINSQTINPPSLNQVARIIGCDKKLLYSHFPVLCRNISSAYYDNLQKKKQKRLEEGCKKIDNAVSKLDTAGIYPSRRKVEEYLSNSIILREKTYQEEWKTSLLRNRQIIGWL